MTISVQIQTVVYMSLCGVLMGMGLDTYQVFRAKGRFPSWLVFLLDVLFWIASIGLVFFVLVRVNDGIVRFPVFLSIFAGGWLYFVLGSKAYIQLLLAVIKFLRWLYRTILSIIDTLIVRPVLFLYRLVWMLLTFLVSLLATIGNFLWKVVVMLTSPFRRWGRNMGKNIGRFGAGVWTRLKKWVYLGKKRE